MTRPSQKKRERFFTEAAIRSLGKEWSFREEREHPDFVLAEGDRQFGLEVRGIFIGQQNHAGSAMKAKESITQSAVNALRREYETIAAVPLHVRFVGNMSPENMAKIIPELIAADLASKPLAHQMVVDTKSGLRVHVTKGYRTDWYSVDERVGFVDRNPQAIIAAAIEEKAQELARYKAAVGADVRLLLVADRIHNSGKLMLDGDSTFDFHGFEAVYLFPYPEPTVALKKASKTAYEDTRENGAI